MTGGLPVLTGMVFSSVVAGMLSLALSLLAGHAFVVALLLYIMAGWCGMLVFIWRAMLVQDRETAA
ncbi:MAG: hypothetical protein WAT09_19340 [Paracoccaceae bacterium]